MSDNGRPSDRPRVSIKKQRGPRRVNRWRVDVWWRSGSGCGPFVGAWALTKRRAVRKSERIIAEGIHG